jgi:DNA-binding XRE family transcriptional regulator
VTDNAHVSQQAQPQAVVEVRSQQELGAAVRRIRRARGMTQTDLAEWIGSNRFTIHRLEVGAPVGLPIVMKAIAVLGYSVTLVPRESQQQRGRDDPRG